MWMGSGVWGGALPDLSALGHDVNLVGILGQGSGRYGVLAAAQSEQRILVTLDKDFGELAILKGLPHSGIIRLAGFRAAQMANAIRHVVGTYERELIAGAIVTVDPERVRIRPA